jgi:hypothetical protein
MVLSQDVKWRKTSEIYVVMAFLLIGEIMPRSNKTPEEHDREKWVRKHATLRRFAALRSAEVRVP